MSAPIQSPFGPPSAGRMDALDEAWDCEGSLIYRAWGNWAWNMGGTVTPDGFKIWISVT